MKLTPELEKALVRVEGLLEKFNPYHGPGGRFATGPGGGGTMAPDTGGAFGGGGAKPRGEKPGEGGGFPSAKETRKLDSKLDRSPGLVENTSRISAKGKDVIKEYTSGEIDYRKMNEKLRGGKMTKDAKRVNQAIGEAGDLPKGTTVYRGLALTPGEKTDMVASFRESASAGGTMKMSGISSTTIDPSVAAGFTRDREGAVVFEIKPKSGAYVSDLSGFDRTARSSKKGRPENEVILQHGKEYRVVAVQDDVSLGKKMTKGWGYTVVQLEEV